jgi:hypothetical protein
LARAEASESADLNLIPRSQGTDDAVKYGADDVVGFLQGHPNRLVNLSGQIGPRHLAYPRCITKKSTTSVIWYSGPPAVPCWWSTGQEPQRAPKETPANANTTLTKKAPRTKRAAKAEETAGPREGSKTARVVAMLQRKNGARLAEIMDQTGWQKHTNPRVHGAMKKAEHTVESFKSDKGERSYRINA